MVLLEHFFLLEYGMSVSMSFRFFFLMTFCCCWQNKNIRPTSTYRNNNSGNVCVCVCLWNSNSIQSTVMLIIPDYFPMMMMMINSFATWLSYDRVCDRWLVGWWQYKISDFNGWFLISSNYIHILVVYIYWPIILCKRPEEKPPFSFSLNVEQQWMEIGKLIHWSSEMYRTHTHNLLLLLSTVKPIQVYGKLAQFFVTTTIALNTTTTTNSWW